MGHQQQKVTIWLLAESAGAERQQGPVSDRLDEGQGPAQLKFAKIGTEATFLGHAILLKAERGGTLAINIT
eukprot:1142871-Pelagomonas_calceolata.AAC.8